MTELRANRVDEALKYAKEAIDWQEKNKGKNSVQYDMAASNLAFIYFQIQDYKASILLREEQLQRYEAFYGKESQEYAMILNMLMSCHLMDKNCQQAIVYGEQALSLYEKLKGKESPEYDMTVNTLALAYVRNKDFAKAITLKKEQLMRYEITYGKESVQCGMVLSNLCTYCVQAGEYETALEYGKQTLDILEPLEGINNFPYEMAVASMSNAYYKKKDYANLIALKQRNLAQCAKIYGKESENYDMALSELITGYIITKQPENIIPLEEERLGIYEAKYGKESMEYASALDDLSHSYSEIEEHVKAVAYSKQAVELYERLSGKESKEYADALYNLTNIMKLAGRFDESKEMTNEALAAKEKMLDQNSVQYVKAQYDIAAEYARNENYPKAIQVVRHIVSVVKEQPGTDSDEYATALETLADYLYKADQFTESITLVREALEIRSKKQDNHYARTLNRLSDIEYSLGNYFESIELLEKALDIWERQESEEAISYRKVALTSLSTVYLALGNRRKAGLLTKEVLELDVKYMGMEYPDIVWRDVENDIREGEDLSNTPEGQKWLIGLLQEALSQIESYGMVETDDYASSLISLATVYIKMKDYAKAVEQIKRAEGIQVKVLGKEHLDYVLTLQMLAYCRWKQDDKESALTLLQEALAISRKLLPENHPDNISLLTSLTIIEAQLGNPATAQHTVEATSLLKRLMLTAFTQLTSLERNRYWNKYNAWFNTNLPNIVNRYKDELSVCTAYDGLLLSKGLLLNSEIEMSKLITESGDQTLLDDYYKLCLTRSKLNNLSMQDAGMADSLEQVATELEKGLLKQCKAYGDYTKKLDITWQTVQKALKPQEAAIEFMTVPLKDGGVDYVALVLRKEDKHPVWVRLFGESELKAITTDRLYTTPQLSTLLWKPLEAYIAPKKKIYFAPAGLLYNIGIEYLQHWKGTGMLADQWQMHRVSSTRRLALTADETPLKLAAVYGGLKYNAGKDVLVQDSKKYPSRRDLGFTLAHIADTLGLRGGIQDLPATRTEAINVDSALVSMHVADSLYIGLEGTEASFKALSGKKVNLLHIATHGFYWTEQEAEALNGLNFLSLDKEASAGYVEDKSLTRSGLLFTGAANVLGGKDLPEDVEDGVLTAKEISTLDLRGLDLVVLSACQTGLGEITGDGVFGLQRGFKKAGANSLLMSLWKVDDEATQMLMTQFYANLMAGKSAYESLLQAQQYLRDYAITVTEDGRRTPITAREKEEAMNETSHEEEEIIHPYRHPKYWAAFILLDSL